MNACTLQIPDVKTGNDRIDAVVVDEESVGSADTPGCGGKVLRGDGALEHYVGESKLKDSVVWALHSYYFCVGAYPHLCICLSF